MQHTLNQIKNYYMYMMLMRRYNKISTTEKLRFVAFPAIEYDEVFSGYQPGQMIKRPLNLPTDLSRKQTGPGINLDRMFFPTTIK